MDAFFIPEKDAHQPGFALVYRHLVFGWPLRHQVYGLPCLHSGLTYTDNVVSICFGPDTVYSEGDHQIIYGDVE